MSQCDREPTLEELCAPISAKVQPKRMSWGEFPVGFGGITDDQLAENASKRRTQGVAMSIIRKRRRGLTDKE